MLRLTNFNDLQCSAKFKKCEQSIVFGVLDSPKESVVVTILGCLTEKKRYINIYDNVGPASIPVFSKTDAVIVDKYVLVLISCYHNNDLLI